MDPHSCSSTNIATYELPYMSRGCAVAHQVQSFVFCRLAKKLDEMDILSPVIMLFRHYTVLLFCV